MPKTSRTRSPSSFMKVPSASAQSPSGPSRRPSTSMRRPRRRPMAISTNRSTPMGTALRKVAWSRTVNTGRPCIQAAAPIASSSTVRTPPPWARPGAPSASGPKRARAAKVQRAPEVSKETGARRPPALLAAWAILPLLAVLSFRRAAIFRDARSLWTSVVADSPSAELGYGMLGKYFMERSDFEAAASVYGKGIARVPRPRNLHNYLGIAYSSQGRLAEAEAQFKEAIRMDPEFVLGIFNLGSIRFRQKRFAEAEVLWRRTLQLSPDHDAAAHFLGELEKSKVQRAPDVSESSVFPPLRRLPSDGRRSTP